MRTIRDLRAEADSRLLEKLTAFGCTGEEIAAAMEAKDTAASNVEIPKLKPGRKPAGESRAAEIRARLAAWKQTPEQERISLRTLAAELGTSHQLLSFYLRRWDKWQIKESLRKAQETRDHGKAEKRSLTPLEEAKSGKLSGQMLEEYAEKLGKAGYWKEAVEVLKLAE